VNSSEITTCLIEKKTEIQHENRLLLKKML